MRQYSIKSWILLTMIILTGLIPPGAAAAAPEPAVQPQSGDVTRFDLIIAMNTLRMSYGLPALVEDPIVNAVAQATAETMAAYEMSWHIGDVRGRLAAAGYGGGATVWATENFAVGTMSIDEIMLAWSDPTHMIPAVNPAYCNVGAGIARSPSGRTYYILQAAYVGSQACGEYQSVAGDSLPSVGQTGVSQVIIPVNIATPDADGKIFHEVQSGQSFWAIAIAYKITIRDIEIWNNISRETSLRVGQRLFIPGSNTEGYATPTPVGMVAASTPDADGRIMHKVQPYQTLITIAQAYDTSVDTILALNYLQRDWPLQIDQELLIDPGRITPSPTPRPLTPIERLTPASDGRYYHTVSGGETLLWIARLYEVSLLDLLSWNGLSQDTIIQPGQQLQLQVTPPATATPTPGPPTLTPTATRIPPSSTPTRTQVPEMTPGSPTTAVTTSRSSGSNLLWAVLILGAAGVLLLGFAYFRPFK